GKAIPRLSDWSLNRDSACGSVFSQVGVLSDTCSGVAQTRLQFANIFSHLPGTGVAAAAAAQGAPQVLTQAPDNPATSPYPIWQPTVAYNAGFKVVWHRLIYQASWWSEGTAPDSGGVSGATSSPWQLIGPVPAGSRAPKPILLLSGSHPKWSPTGVYRQGDVVSFDGLPFKARWYTQGDQPITSLPVNPQQPWTPLYEIPGEPAGSG
ncbi:MAG: carbohydrate-binding protein, partial [Solirubrobacteraceae bacterium]